MASHYYYNPDQIYRNEHQIQKWCRALGVSRESLLAMSDYEILQRAAGLEHDIRARGGANAWNEFIMDDPDVSSRSNYDDSPSSYRTHDYEETTHDDTISQNEVIVEVEDDPVTGRRIRMRAREHSTGGDTSRMDSTRYSSGNRSRTQYVDEEDDDYDEPSYAGFSRGASRGSPNSTMASNTSKSASKNTTMNKSTASNRSSSTNGKSYSEASRSRIQRVLPYCPCASSTKR